METPRLILASASPRRQELIALLGLPYEIVPSRYVEPPAPTEAVDLAALVQGLALAKAQEVATRCAPGYVLGADTLVTLAAEGAGIPLGKPTDPEDACRMLGLLSGQVHSVYTGIALIPVWEDRSLGLPHTLAVQTRVRFRPLSATMIADYVATGEPLDKAGAYGAQGYAAPFIEGFEGDFFNVVGLPLCAVGQLLEQVGVEWWHYRQQMPPLRGSLH